MQKLLLSFFIAISTIAVAQTGGTNYFPFLNLNYNARSAGLGGDFITARDKDVNIGVLCPSLLNPEMDRTIGFNQALLAGGINYGMLSYGQHLDKIGTLGTSIKYVNYGKFQRTAVNGVNEGEFSPFEMLIGASLGRQLNPRIAIGGGLNFIYSQLESYNAFGASIDLAGTYINSKENLLVSVRAKNAGLAFDRYVKDGERAPLPAEIQAGISYKLEHAPFRFSLLGHSLNQWDLTYTDPSIGPTIDPLTGDTTFVKVPGFLEKLGRHFTYQVEVLVTKNIHFRAAFDYQRRKEMQLISRPGAAGLSFGLGLYFKKFSIDYGFMIYSRAGFNNVFTLTTHLSEWRK